MWCYAAGRRGVALRQARQGLTGLPSNSLGQLYRCLSRHDGGSAMDAVDASGSWLSQGGRPRAEGTCENEWSLICRDVREVRRCVTQQWKAVSDVGKGAGTTPKPYWEQTEFR